MGISSPSKDASLAASSTVSGAAREKLSSEALGSLSHDLNNALSVILTSSTSLLRREPADPTMRRQLELVRRSAIRIHALSEELSDALAVDSGQLELKLAPLEVGQVLQEAVEIAQQLVPQRGVRISGGQHPLWVRGDHLRLQRVFAHLLRSALLATPDGTAEVIVERRASDACIRIEDGQSSPMTADPGAGTPLGHASESQSHSLARYVSHGVLRAHGGQLSIEPRSEGRCALLVSLPISEHAPAS